MHREAFTSLLQIIEDGKVSQEHLNASVRRILETKGKYNILYPALLDEPAKAGVLTATAKHHALAWELAQKAITLLKDDASLLPLKPGEPLLVIETAAAKGLGTLLGATAFEIDNDPDGQSIAAALSMANGAIKIIVATTDANLYPGQVKLVNKLMEKNPNIVMISVRTPYDINVLPMVPTVLAAYGSNLPMLRAIAEVLMGKSEATGVLPVALS